MHDGAAPPARPARRRAESLGAARPADLSAPVAGARLPARPRRGAKRPPSSLVSPPLLAVAQTASRRVAAAKAKTFNEGVVKRGQIAKKLEARGMRGSEKGSQRKHTSALTTELGSGAA